MEGYGGTNLTVYERKTYPQLLDNRHPLHTFICTCLATDSSSFCETQLSSNAFPPFHATMEAYAAHNQLLFEYEVGTKSRILMILSVICHYQNFLFLE